MVTQNITSSEQTVDSEMFLRQIDPGGRARQGRTYRRYRTLSAKLTLLSSLILLLDPVSAQTRETVRLSIAGQYHHSDLMGTLTATALNSVLLRKSIVGTKPKQYRGFCKKILFLTSN